MPSYRIPLRRKDGRGIYLEKVVEAPDAGTAMDMAEDQANDPDRPEAERYEALTVWDEKGPRDVR